MARRLPLIAFALIAAASVLAAPLRAAASDRMLPDSVAPTGGGGKRGTITRSSLRPEETRANFDFNIALRMRNLDELQARVRAGDAIPPAEMEARYLPLQSDYDRVSAWLVSQGFVLTLPDSNHTNIFARGTVAAVAQTFGVSFARVSTSDGEFTSAVTAPSVPSDIADAILDVGGLQPHIRAHVPKHSKIARAVTLSSGFFTPADVTTAYQAPSDLSGAGQTIAIIIDSAPAKSDLTSFWTTTGVAQTAANFTTVAVNGAAGTSDASEAALDAEWAGAMAPGAKIRVYTLPSLSNSNILAACTQVLNDAKADPTLRILSMSFGNAEWINSFGTIVSYNQAFTQMTAAGITACAASGDGGSNEVVSGASSGSYSSSATLSPSHPATDPNVTGVGGTTLGFDSAFNPISETTWFDNSNPSDIGASGGGISGFFVRPSWQTGTGVPSGPARCVPDVAVVSDFSVPGLGTSQYGGLIVVNGSPTGVGGTSLATPIFAGIVALINESRSNVGLSSVGLLGPRLYPLIGTTAFKDITTGSNGAYNAGTGYDLCSGIGSPKIGNLVAALTATLPSPGIAVDGHKSGDTVAVPSGGSAKITVRFIAADLASRLSGIRYNIWNPPAGSTTPFAGTFSNNGGAFVSTPSGGGEVDQSVTLTPGDWYFWTDALNTLGDQASTGAWTGGFVLHVVSGGSSTASSATNALAGGISVDGHNSGDTIALASGGTVKVTVRNTGLAVGGDLAGIRANVWNPPTGSLVPFAGYFTNGGGYIAASGGTEEIVSTVVLTPGDWYFWTDAKNSAAAEASSGPWAGAYVLHVTAGGSSATSTPSVPDVAPVPAITVDGHNSGDKVTIQSGGTATVVVRFKATDTSSNLSGIRYNVWNPPSGSTTPFAGFFTNGGGFVSESGSSGEVDLSVTLTAGDWYFWTDAQNSAGDSTSTGSWTAGFVLHVGP